MAPGDIITHAYFSLLSQRVPFTDDANKPILKQSLQPYFWPHITLNANLQINQPFPKIARRFSGLGAKRIQTSGAASATAAISAGPNATTKPSFALMVKDAPDFAR